MITFSYHAELSIPVDKFKNIDAFNRAIDSIPLMGYTTRIDKALRLAKEKLMVGAREDAPKFVFLLTDGSQTQDAGAENPATIAKELRDEGIRLVVIGIGGGVKPDELKRIAGIESNLFLAADFDKLKSSSFVQNVSSESCKKGKFPSHTQLHMSVDCIEPSSVICLYSLIRKCCIWL